MTETMHAGKDCITKLSVSGYAPHKVGINSIG